jgi:hypothetical protein
MQGPFASGVRFDLRGSTYSLFVDPKTPRNNTKQNLLRNKPTLKNHHLSGMLTAYTLKSTVRNDPHFPT